MKKPLQVSKFSKITLLLFFFLSGSFGVVAVIPLKVATYNLSSFTPQKTYNDIEKLSAINSMADIANPDFGKVAPGVNASWYEIYNKRTATSRTFVGENGSTVNGYSYTPINYKDKQGNYIAIDPFLSPSQTGWSSLHQAFPTYLHADGSTEITLSDKDVMKFNFNSTVAGANLSVNNFTVGDNGMMIYNAVTGVDKRIVFRENEIETDYLLSKPLTRVVGDLVISEEIILPSGYSIKEKNMDGVFGLGSNRIEMIVVNMLGIECAHFKVPVCNDSNTDKSKRKQSTCFGNYQLRTVDGRNFLDVIIPAAWLTDASRMYPVTIDPVVTGPTVNWTGGVINSCFYPSFNTQSIVCTIPADITITNFIVTASYYADPTTFTYMSDGLMYLTTSCGRSPSDATLYYTILSPAGDTAGTAYMDHFDLASDLACCFAPSCSAQNLTLTMNLSRTYGDALCDDTYIYYNPTTLYPFMAYIVGNTVEATWSAAPTTLCANICTLGLTAVANYGVPPYTLTHPWASSNTVFGAHTANSCNSAGTGTLTLNIPNCPTTCGSVNSLSVPAPTITDACGNTVSGLVSQSVTQNPMPIVTPSPTSLSVCTGTPVTITLNSCVAGSSISWTGSNGSSGSGNIVNTPINAGTSSITVNYTVNVSVNGCLGSPVIVPVTVYPKPTINISPSSPSICNGKSVSLTASGANTYIWSPSTGLSATTGANVSANPSSTTPYIISATDINGCTNTGSVTVIVNSVPTIGINPTASVLCNGQSVSLFASGANTYSWGPSTGLSSSVGSNVSAGPSSTTTYTVTGTDGNGCTNTKSITVTVDPAAVILVGPSSPVLCNGQSVDLTASGGNTYVWSPGTGLSATNIATVTANPSSSNTYIVTGTDANGCTGTASITVTVNPLPSVSVNPSSPVLCAGQAVTLTGSGGVTYTWGPSNGLSSTNGTTVSANPTSTNTYTVTGTDVNGCSNTASATVTVHQLPSISVDPPSPAICNGQSVDLTASGGSTYSWSPSSGLSSTSGTIVSVNPTSTNTYTVIGTDINGCTNTSTATVTVNQLPVVNAGSDAGICPNDSAQLNVTGPPPGSTYTWTPSTNLSCTHCSNPFAFPQNNATYIVMATTPDGCSAQDTVNVIVTPLSPKAGPDTAICNGNPVQLYASGGTDYLWTPSTGLSDSAISNPIAITEATATYTVTISSGSCNATATVKITVFATLLTPTIRVSGDTLYCSYDPAYTAYQWYYSNNPIQGATHSSYFATQSGNYNIAVYDENGCSISVGINIVINVGVQNIYPENSISLYPNPATDQLTIYGTSVNAHEAVTVSVLDVLGQIVQQEKIYWDKEQQINIKALSSGAYFLQLQTEHGRWLGKFVKE